MHTKIPLLIAALTVGCTKSDVDPIIVDTDPDFLDISIDFRANVGLVPFSCNQEYQNVGSTSAIVRFQDLRFYVYNMGLTDSTGNTTLLDLDPGPFQGQNLALMDFEDGEWNCDGGTPERHMSVTGTVPFADYTGLAFTIGVPFELNHPQDPTSQGAPLDDATMFTGPLLGYYFFKLETTSVGEPDGYPAYITSTGCTVGPTGDTEDCTSPNRRTWVFNSFDPSENRVVIDLAALLSRNDLNNNSTTTSAETPAGCQSLTSDEDCQNLFISYGLSAVEPTFLSVE